MFDVKRRAEGAVATVGVAVDVDGDPETSAIESTTAATSSDSRSRS